MFLVFTPFTYFFLSFYLIFFFFLFSSSNFIIFWVFMEFIMLIFMGISYTLFSSNFSSLMLYFLIQTLSSFSIFLFYLSLNPVLLSLSLFIKLSMFPFHFWFLNVCYRFPNFVVFLSSSLHNVPVFLFVLLFNPALSASFLSLSLLLTVLFSGSMMLSASDFRAILLSSSVGNNSWFVLSSLLDVFSFFLFLTCYTFFLFFVIQEIGALSKPLVSKFSSGYFSLYFYVLFLSGLPPFPIFFANIYVLFSLFLLPFNNLFLFVFISFSSLILIGYLYSISNYFVHSYSSSGLQLVK